MKWKSIMFRYFLFISIFKIAAIYGFATTNAHSSEIIKGYAKADHPNNYPLNIRSRPYFDQNKIGVLPDEALVPVFTCKRVRNEDEERHWCLVRYNGQKGWVSAKYLRLIRKVKPATIGSINSKSSRKYLATTSSPRRRGNPNKHCCYEFDFRETNDKTYLTEVILNPNDTWGHIVYTTVVEPYFAASFSLAKTRGEGDMDLIIGTEVYDGNGNAKIEGVIGSSTLSGEQMDIVVIPPSSSRRRIYINIYTANKKEWTGRLYLRRASIHGTITSTFLIVTGQRMMENAIMSFLGATGANSPENSQARAIAERAITATLAGLTNEHLTGAGIDIAVGELQSKLSREFPGDGNRFAILWATTTLSRMLKRLYHFKILHAEGRLQLN